MQDVPQNEALRTPLHVVLSGLFEGKVTLKESCAECLLCLVYRVTYQVSNLCLMTTQTVTTNFSH